MSAAPSAFCQSCREYMADNPGDFGVTDQEADELRVQ